MGLHPQEKVEAPLDQISVVFEKSLSAPVLYFSQIHAGKRVCFFNFQKIHPGATSVAPGALRALKWMDFGKYLKA